jgi:hypothetical protein
MSAKTYKPSFLISAEVPNELRSQLISYASRHGITEEEVYRKALKFFAARCVHTQARSPRRRTRKVR